MKFSSLLVVAISTILAVGFTGCGKPPEPYNYKINNQYDSISDYEKQQLLNIVINKYASLKYQSFNGCISVNPKAYDDKMKNCFIIKNNHIIREDYSICRIGNQISKCDYHGVTVEKYADFINNLQNNIIGNELNNEIEKYQVFTKLYDNIYNASKVKKDNVKISLVDNTKILPRFALEKLNEFTLNTNKVIKIDLYKSYYNQFLEDKSSFIQEFKIHSAVMNYIVDRYKVDYKQTNYSNSYDKFPTSLIYEIDKVYFNYLPEKFTAEDNNIDIEVKNNILIAYGYPSIEYIKIYNKTKELIELDTISGYYGENVLDNILNIQDTQRVKIPPKSYKIFKLGYNEYSINDYPKTKLLLVKDKNQYVPYGFSIGYKMINQNIIKNLYKVNKYSIKDFQ